MNLNYWMINIIINLFIVFVIFYLFNYLPYLSIILFILQLIINIKLLTKKEN
jgi:hypothetical protein